MHRLVTNTRLVITSARFTRSESYPFGCMHVNDPAASFDNVGAPPAAACGRAVFPLARPARRGWRAAATLPIRVAAGCAIATSSRADRSSTRRQPVEDGRQLAELAEVAGLVAPVAAARLGLAPEALGPMRVVEATDINQGRGVFSRVLRLTVAVPGTTPAPEAEPGWDDGPGPDRERLTLVAKFPVGGPNGEAARRSGAYRREALAYRRILPRSPVRTPRAELVVDLPDGGVLLVLDDLSDRRRVDQLDGLDGDDALAVARALAGFHRHWAGNPELDRLPVRRSVPSGLAAEGLRAGLRTLDGRWSTVVPERERRAFRHLVGRREELADAFSRAGPATLCHGDPRADNLVFDPDGVPVLFDWQQLAVQFGPADLAWLAATSLTTGVRREVEPDLVAGYGTTFDLYRLGLVLPGLAVLFLAQRQLDDQRSRRFVAASLRRIGAALVDLDPAG